MNIYTGEELACNAHDAVKHTNMWNILKQITQVYHGKNVGKNIKKCFHDIVV